MRRCYRGVALVLGMILLSSNTLSNSCRLNVFDVYAAEDTLANDDPVVVSVEISTEETIVASNEKIKESETITTENTNAEFQTGEENVETEIPAEEPETNASQATEEKETAFKLEYNDYNVLLKIVEAEAGGEDLTGKMLVANVILNRVNNDQFPDTVTEVVYQKTNGSAQFSPTVDGRINSVSISQETLEAVERVLNGEDYSNGALYFRSVRCDSTWFDNSLRRVVEHGNHIFYTI